MEIRRLTDADAEQAWRLGSQAFGGPDEPPATWRPEMPGCSAWGVFEGPRMLARAVDRHQAHYFGGRSVPVAGLAGVSVLPEARGAGVGRLVLTHVLEQAHERGAAVSLLFPTTAAPYRRLGWERAGAGLTWSVPTASLADVRPPAGVSVRRAEVADLDPIVALHGEAARTRSGGTDRTSTVYRQRSAELRLADYSGTTLAVDEAGETVGFMAWDRSKGYRGDGVIEVHDLVGVRPAALAALLANLGTWASVAYAVQLRLAVDDPVLLLSGLVGATVVDEHPWMARLVDAPAAVASRGWPTYLTGAVDLHLSDAECPWNDGPWRLEVAGGTGALSRGGAGSVRMGARAAAAWYAGMGLGPLRAAGLVDGDAAHDAFLTAATAGVPGLVDYF